MSTPDTTDDDTVWYSPSYSSDGVTYHEDKDCHHCGETAMPKARETLPHYREPCPYCAGGSAPKTGPKGRTCPRCGETVKQLAYHLRRGECDG